MRIENELLAIDVLPELGGKVYRWIQKPLGRDWLWQHPTILPTPLPPNASFDDHWCGGWDDLFPSDAPCLRGGLQYPDHGEYWNRPFTWDIDRSTEGLTLHLCAEGRVTPTRLERWLTVAPSSPVVRIRYRLMHHGVRPLEYFWRLHPALAITPWHRILIPAEAGRIASPACGRLANQQASFAWPYAPGNEGCLHDLRTPPAEGTVPGHEMLWLHPIRAGWFALLDRHACAGFGIAFDHAFFTNVWLFQSFGGWRGLYVAAIEPCTANPYDRPIATGDTLHPNATLQPGQVLATTIAVVVFTGRTEVSSIAEDGTVC